MGETTSPLQTAENRKHPLYGLPRQFSEDTHTLSESVFEPPGKVAKPRIGTRDVQTPRRKKYLSNSGASMSTFPKG